RAILARGEARLAISIYHLYELSAAFAGRTDVGVMLDAAPLVWAIHPIPDRFDCEVRSVLGRVLAGSTAPPGRLLRRCPPCVESAGRGFPAALGHDPSLRRPTGVEAESRGYR